MPLHEGVRPDDSQMILHVSGDERARDGSQAAMPSDRESSFGINDTIAHLGRHLAVWNREVELLRTASLRVAQMAQPFC